MKTVIITGAAGDIGTRLRKLLKGVYPQIRSSDIRKPADLTADDAFTAADLADYAQVEKIVEGVDGIVHLGGFSVEGPWDDPQRQHHRLLQSLRGGAPGRREAHRVCVLQSRGRFLPAAGEARP